MNPLLQSKFLRSNFKISGLFYEIDAYKFRSYLNIIRKDSEVRSPDLMVVMMNPGSSKPVDGIENNTIESEAVPDSTQDQIMRVMQICHFSYARILNLSDLREPKSSILYEKITELESLNIPHSIFDQRRIKDFENYFVNSAPVIFAWGVNEQLQALANNAKKRIGAENPIGYKKEGLDFAYYHPLPQSYTKQKEWLEKICDMIFSPSL